MASRDEDDTSRLLGARSWASRVFDGSTWVSVAEQEQQESQWKASCSLYGSHFLSAWGQRMWEFAISLIMLEIGDGSLMLVAVFGLTDSLAVFLTGPSFGSWIDRTERLKAACTMYMLQNATVASSAATAFAALSAPRGGIIFWSCTALTILLGAASSACAMGATLSVEREWTKTLSDGNSRRLADLNAGMRRIDLACLILSPIMVGMLMSFAGIRVAILLIVAWNSILASLPEWLLLRFAKAHSEALRRDPEVDHTEGKEALPVFSGWLVYARQEIVLPALALALLYLTVLSFGMLTTAYLKWRGMSEAELSIYRGLGAIEQKRLCSYIHLPLAACKSLWQSGGFGIGWQLLSLLAAVTPAAVQRVGAKSFAATYALVFGLISSRLGLWLFDLSVGQLLQERVATSEIGVVNGVQGSLANLFQGLSYVAALLSPDPENFEWLMLASWAVVSVSSLLYCIWVLQTRHLLPTKIQDLKTIAMTSS